LSTREFLPFCFSVRNQLRVLACHGAKVGADGYFFFFHIAIELLGGKVGATTEMSAKLAPPPKCWREGAM
jgi:hypothetical protein